MRCSNCVAGHHIRCGGRCGCLRCKQLWHKAEDARVEFTLTVTQARERRRAAAELEDFFREQEAR